MHLEFFDLLEVVALLKLRKMHTVHWSRVARLFFSVFHCGGGKHKDEWK